MYAAIEWAVGTFRVEASGATDCVVVPSEGFGYIPWGVFLPRNARTLAADTLVANGFRDRWFSPQDPVQVLGEYAQLRAGRGARLVAVATTNSESSIRIPGVETAVCLRDMEPEALRPAVLDDLHQHRLETVHPDIYARVARLCDNENHTREVMNQIADGTAAQMLEALRYTGICGLQVPAELWQMWDATGSDRAAISLDAWKDYHRQAITTYVLTSVGRPGPDASTGERELYRGQWQVARAMEIVWGLSPDAEKLARETGGPLWADILYAAASSFDVGEFIRAVGPALQRVENAR